MKDVRTGISDSIADAVGGTPLIRLNRMHQRPNQRILAKCEFLNPGGSVKDRIAFYMVEKAEADGRLKPGGLIVEATGGNTGIGLALAATLRGYKLLCVMSEKVGKEKVRMMQILGAEVVVLPAGKSITDPEHPINKAKAIAEERGGWYVGQFDNADNLEAHYKSTGPEIWQQTGGKVDVLVAGIGTGGTLFGAGKYLKDRNPNVKLVLADPQGSLLADWQAGSDPTPGPYVIEGIGGDSLPGIVDLSRVDRSIKVSDEDSIRTAHDLVRKEALFVGGSSGCIVAAAMRYCDDFPDQDLTVVVILPSTGRLYTQTIFDDDWLLQRTKITY